MPFLFAQRLRGTLCLLCVPLLTVTGEIFAAVTNAPPIEWQASFGGTLPDRPNVIGQTSDGGFFVGGFSYSTNGNKTSPNYGVNDYWLLRLSANGAKVWDQSFGGKNIDQLYGVQQTTDGGFLLAGTSYSDGGTGNKASTNYGGGDIWIVRVSTNGALLSQATYGGSGTDGAFNLSRVADGGFVVAGYSSSTNGNKISRAYGAIDYWLLRLDEDGSKLWEASYGGNGNDYLVNVVQMSDGGFLLGGFSDSAPGGDGNKTADSFGGYDYWLVRVDASGTKLWDRSYGGTNSEQLATVCINSTNGIVLAGHSNSNPSGNKTSGHIGDTDFWIVGTDENGVPKWDRTYGGNDAETLLCAATTAEGDILAGGSSTSGVSGNKTSPAYGEEDMWLLRLNKEGHKIWDQSYGGTDEDQLCALAETEDGGFILGGYLRSSSAAGIAPDLGAGDVWTGKTVGVPLIFLPGMGGSDLYHGTDEFAQKLWPSILPGIFERLTLDPKKPQESVYAYDVSRFFDDDINLPILGKRIHIYDKLLDALLRNGRFREYLVEGDPERRTALGMDLAQLANAPTLFPFAYDWRRSNKENARKLADYVAGIQSFYPGTKVDIVAHSNGGLVAKRYLLDHPNNHYVRKLLTIATPFLGTPLAIYRMERGQFFDVVPVDALTSGAIKDILEFFPGVHELLPGERYFGLSGDRVYEDIDGKPYTFEQFRDLMDQRFESKPASTTQSFHTSAQDDSTPGAPDVEALQIAGKQSSARTIGTIRVRRDITLARQRIRERPVIGTILTKGDQTVTLISSERSAAGYDPKTTIELTPVGGETDADVKHFGLPLNPRVHKIMFDFLHGKLPAVGAFASLNGVPETELFYVDILGVDYVQVTDGAGHTNSRLNAEFALAVPEVDYSSSGSNAVSIVLPISSQYALTFRTIDEPLKITVVRGVGNEVPEAATRFLDLVLPTNVNAQLTFSTNGIPSLRYDGDGNGSFETLVNPTADLIGTAAVDVTPPKVSFSLSCSNSYAVIALSGEDMDSGIHDIYYTLDRVQSFRYTNAFVVDPVTVPAVYAFSTDNAGNRTELLSLSLRPRLDFWRSPTNSIVISWPNLCPAGNLQQSLSLNPPQWTAAPAPAVLRGNIYSVELPLNATNLFFRLTF